MSVFKRAEWHSGLTYQQTCRECSAVVQYTDKILGFRPWFPDGFVYCPKCDTPLRHNEEYAIDDQKKILVAGSKDKAVIVEPSVAEEAPVAEVTPVAEEIPVEEVRPVEVEAPVAQPVIDEEDRTIVLTSAIPVLPMLQEEDSTMVLTSDAFVGNAPQKEAQPAAVAEKAPVVAEEVLPPVQPAQPEALSAFCHQCGKKFLDGDRFCVGCGAKRR